MIDSADNVTHMLPVTGPMRLQFATDATDAAPLFVAELTQDLLGDWVVTQLWSGKPQARGGGRVTVVSDQDAGSSSSQESYMLIIFLKAVLLIPVTLLPILNPFGVAPVFANLLGNVPAQIENRVARQVAINCWFLLVGAIFVGSHVL
eukprot:gene21754-22713_t